LAIMDGRPGWRDATRRLRWARWGLQAVFLFFCDLSNCRLTTYRFTRPPDDSSVGTGCSKTHTSGVVARLRLANPLRLPLAMLPNCGSIAAGLRSGTGQARKHLALRKQRRGLLAVFRNVRASRDPQPVDERALKPGTVESRVRWNRRGTPRSATGGNSAAVWQNCRKRAERSPSPISRHKTHETRRGCSSARA